MESSSLFNSGFLGSHFNWWIGQIADDSTWRDNFASSKHENPNDGLGWGARYKVRIIGMHDTEEESIPSDQLPWAQIMYPVTAGSGHANTSASPALRQGAFVFGFFLDGADQQVPVIMGVLGNNPQTQLSRVIGTTESSFSAISGHAQGQDPDPHIRVPDHGLAITQETSTTIETPLPHQQSVADIKRDEVYNKKIVFINPCDLGSSALNGIFLKIQEVTETINKYLDSAQKYVDAATKIINDIRKFIASISCEIAKYLSYLFVKLRDFIVKKIESLIEPTIQTLPPNKRNTFIPIKEKIIEIIYCLFNGIIDQLCGQIESYLNQKLKVEEITPTNLDSYTLLSPVCSAEQLASDILSDNMMGIDNTIKRSIDILNSFLADIATELAAAGGLLSTIRSFINGFEGSLAAALTFENIKLNVFGCDIKVKCSITDFYTLDKGGLAMTNSPRPERIASRTTITSDISSTTSPSPTQFLTPPIRNVQ